MSLHPLLVQFFDHVIKDTRPSKELYNNLRNLVNDPTYTDPIVHCIRSNNKNMMFCLLEAFYDEATLLDGTPSSVTIGTTLDPED